MAKFDAQPHDIHALLNALDIAAELNQQLVACLQASGTAALFDF